MLETVTDPNKINIQNLNIIEPKPTIFEPMFDPEKEISQKDLNAIRDASISNKWADAKIRRLFELKLLFPHATQDFSNDTLYDWAMNNLSNMQNIKQSRAIVADEVKRLAEILQIFPEKRQEIKTRAAKFKIPVLEEIENSGSIVYPNLEDCFEYALVFPNEVLPAIRGEDWLKIWQDIDLEHMEEYYVSDYEGDYGNDYIGEFPINAARFRLLYPDEPVSISPEQWKHMQEELAEHRTNLDWPNFLELAWAMQVLSAEKASLKEDGTIEIIPPSPKLTHETPPLPEVRKF